MLLQAPLVKRGAVSDAAEQLAAALQANEELRIKVAEWKAAAEKAQDLSLVAGVASRVPSTISTVLCLHAAD